jgi:hypothetical protein
MAAQLDEAGAEALRAHLRAEAARMAPLAAQLWDYDQAKRTRRNALIDASIARHRKSYTSVYCYALSIVSLCMGLGTGCEVDGCPLDSLRFWVGVVFLLASFAFYVLGSELEGRIPQLAAAEVDAALAAPPNTATT